MLNVEGECAHTTSAIINPLNGECEGQGRSILDRMLNCEGECHFSPSHSRPSPSKKKKVPTPD